MVAIVNVFKALMATSLIAIVNANSVGQVVDSLNLAADSYVNFHAAVKAFNRQTAEYGVVDTREVAVEEAVQYAIATARDSAPLSADESKLVMAALGLPYPEFMGDLLKDIVAKKAQIVQIGEQGGMVRKLQTLKGLSEELPDALERIVDDKSAAAIEGGRVWVEVIFEDAVNAFAQ